MPRRLRPRTKGMGVPVDKKTLARFWNKVEKTDGCWLWRAALMADGYGIFRVEVYGSMQLAHRVSWHIAHGAPCNRWVLHKCDVRACVNPAHLFEGNVKDNAEDMARKLRSSGLKLNVEQVREIRARFAAGETQESLATAFSVRQPNISRIVHRVTWAWLD